MQLMLEEGSRGMRDVCIPSVDEILSKSNVFIRHDENNNPTSSTPLRSNQNMHPRIESQLVTLPCIRIAR